MPKTIKEIVKEFSINYISEYRWKKDAINNLSAEDFVKQSLLSLLDEVEKRLPERQEIVEEDKFISESGDYTIKTVKESYNSYRQQVIKILSNMRGGK